MKDPAAGNPGEEPERSEPALPDVENLDVDSDLTPFLAEGVDAALHQAAFRRLFSRPEFNTRDGLDDYDRTCRSFVALGDLIPSGLRHRMSLREAGLGRSPEAKGTEAHDDLRPPLGEEADRTWHPSSTGEQGPTEVEPEEPAWEALGEPPFVRLQEAKCAHGSGRPLGCGRCLLVCPAACLAEKGGRVRLDAGRCLDCGACATACPTGALENHAPWLHRLREELGSLVARGPCSPAPPLVYWGRSDGEPEGLDERLWTVVPVESVWATGLELWLAILATGASAVRVALPVGAPAGMTGELARQMAAARALLGAMGYPDDSVALWDGTQPGERPASRAAPAPVSLRDVWEIADRRGTIRRALAALMVPGTELPEAIALPEGAPFGEVLLDGERCTLCMACAGACPSKALRAAPDLPRLHFREADCTQCGLCVATCPEGILSHRPRYHYRAQQDRAERVLHSAEAFSCLRCGRPFATRGMVDRIAEKLLGHWMFPNEAAMRRVRMCRDCRVADLLEEQERGAPPGLPR